MFSDIRKTLLRSLGIIIFIGILIFTYFRYSAYIHGPEITSVNLETFMSVENPSIIIKADIKNTQSVIINGRNIILKEKSNFDEIITFSPGTNSIEIQLIDTFGKERKYLYTVYYTPIENIDYPKTLTEAKNKQDLEQEELSLENTN